MSLWPIVDLRDKTYLCVAAAGEFLIVLEIRIYLISFCILLLFDHFVFI